MILIDMVVELFIRWWKQEHKFINATDAATKTHMANELDYKNLMERLNIKIRQRINNGQNMYIIGWGVAASDYELHEQIRAHKERIFKFLKDSGYTVEEVDSNIINIKWGDKKTLFNNQMKEIIES